MHTARTLKLARRAQVLTVSPVQLLLQHAKMSAAEKADLFGPVTAVMLYRYHSNSHMELVDLM